MSDIHAEGKRSRPGGARPRTLRRLLGRAAATLIAVVVTLAAPEAQQPPRAASEANPTEKLFEAVYANDFEASQAAIAAGADVAAKDTWGLTPVDIAIDKGYYEIAHFLLSVRNFQGSDRPLQAANAPERPAAVNPAATVAAQQDAQPKARPKAEPKATPRKAKPKAAPQTSDGSASSAAASKSAPAGSVVVTKRGFSLPAALVGAPAPSANKAAADKSAAVTPVAEKPVVETEEPEPRSAGKARVAPRPSAAPSRSAASTATQPAAKPVAKPTAPAAPKMATAAAPRGTPWPEDEPHPFDPSTPVPGALPAAGAATPQPGSASAD
ncbi:MAG: hypothetical protein IPM60_04570 [Rhodospirillales bacterium]|nr:hypothetical protein [Rhodospirillales bacterium]